MLTSLSGIANRAKTHKKHRFGNIYGMLNEENLTETWRYISKNAAYGVDRVSAQEYARNLTENIRNLVDRLKRKSYKAKLVRRKYIPKDEKGTRPLGIPATEDKLLQLAVKRILETIYEEDFLECSMGYRPRVGALQAVEKLRIKLQNGKYNYVVEADIKSFFDKVDPDWMERMLKERIADKAMIRLIRKWLRAGIMEEDGKITHPTTGTPQGGVISPLLANIYLHYVLDLWFEKCIGKKSGGEAMIIRYADDFVAIFQYQEDARNFYQKLGERLEKFGLELSLEKTRKIRFSRFRKRENDSFEFLGFEFRWGTGRKGQDRVHRLTSRKKLRKSLQRFKLWCKENCCLRMGKLMKILNIKLRGYYNYYGVTGNYKSLEQFYKEAKVLLFKRLNRRSQRRSYNWHGFSELLRFYRVLKPRIVHRVIKPQIEFRWV